MTRYAIVALGGAAGAMARYWLSGWAHNRWGPGFPYGTLIINVSGSFVLGLFATLTLRYAWSDEWRLLVAIGFLGAFTTFSTFEYETLQLLAEGKRYGAAFVNLVGSVAAGLAAAYAGVVVARLLFALRVVRQ
jgi:fluoride exporter